MRVSPIFFVSIFATAFIWEHIARLHNADQRPSIALNAIANVSVSTFYWIGAQFAWISSFLNWIDLGEFQKTALSLWQSIWSVAISPTELLKGYYFFMISLPYSYAVILGSLLLIGGPLFTLYGWPKIPESRSHQKRVRELCALR